ncbi:MAG: endonuclease [Bdellovibrionales bacterium]|nr:endonuclease [Bdellovibrionales bacterium]
MIRAINGLRQVALLAFLLYTTTSHATILQTQYSQTPIRYYGAQFEPALKQGLKNEGLKKYLNEVLKSDHYAKDNDYDQIGNCPEVESGRCYHHFVYNYTDARKILFGQLHLTQVGNSYAIKGVYCNTFFGDESFGRGNGPSPGRIPSHQVVNAEHTWPQSHFTKRYPALTQKTDLHHLFPSSSRMNSTRGNRDFGIVEKMTAETCPAFKVGLPSGIPAVHAEPPDSHKGNVARAMMYFSIRNETPINTYQEAVFRLWNKMDPVDAEEWNRAEAIFTVQGVRNPFIDFPNLADYIADF